MRVPLILGIVLAAIVIAAPAASGQTSTAGDIAAAIATELPPSSSVVLLPVVNNRLDLSGRGLGTLGDEVATRLRLRGFAVRTLEEAPLRGIASRTIGGSNAIQRAGLRSFADASGIGLLLLLALAQAQDPPRVMASIYESTNGEFGQVWESRVGWRIEKEPVSPRPVQTTSCSGNLLLNGNFEQDWAIGWKRDYGYGDLVRSGQSIGSSVTEIAQGVESRVLHVQHTGPSSVTMHQTVAVPKGQIWFQYEAKVAAREGGMIGFSGTGTAAVGLELLGPRQETLGIMWAGTYVNIWEGMPLAGIPQSPTQTNTEAFDRLPNGETVRRRFDVTTFVRDRMGRIDLDRISYIRVRIAVGANDRNAGAEAWIDNLIIEACPR